MFDFEDFVSFVATILLLVLIIGLPISMSNNIQDLEREAVKSGAAYYKVDNDTGKAKFTWKHLEKAEK